MGVGSDWTEIVLPVLSVAIEMCFPSLERKASTLENYIQETREVSALGMFEISFLGWSQPTRRMPGSSDFYCNHFWGPLAVRNTCARLSWLHTFRSE